MDPLLIDAGFALAGSIGGCALTMIWASGEVEKLTRERQEARAIACRQRDTADARLALLSERNAEIKGLRAELAHWKPARGQGGRFLKAGRVA